MSARQALSKAAISMMKAPPSFEALRGTQARVAAGVQGYVWSGIVGQTEIAEVVHAIDLADEHGDAIRPRIWRLVARMTALAKARRDLEIHALGVEALGLARHYEEHEAHEDSQRPVLMHLAAGSKDELHAANRGLGTLLGQAELAACAVTLGALALTEGGPDVEA